MEAARRLCKAVFRLEIKYLPQFVQFVLHQVALCAFAAFVLIIVVALTLYVIVIPGACGQALLVMSHFKVDSSSSFSQILLWDVQDQSNTHCLTTHNAWQVCDKCAIFLFQSKLLA